MDNQERNREALIEHIAEQDRIIRRRNEQIAGVRERADELSRELAAAVTRAEKAEMESGRGAEVAERWREAHDDLVSLRRTDPPRPLTPDAIEVALHDCMPNVALDRLSGTQVMRLAEDMHAALTEPPKRPEGAEKVEKVLHHYWSGDIDGDDLADRIVEEMNR